MMRKLLFVFLLFLTACASNTGSDIKEPKAWLRIGTSVMLPSPSQVTPFKEQQLLTATAQGKSYSMVAMLDVSKDSIDLAGLSSMGIRLFLLHYDQTGIHTEQHIKLDQLPPSEQVLLDIMLSYWPLDVWKTQLPKGWTLSDAGDKRYLKDPKGKVITTIGYQNIQQHRVPVEIQNDAFDYHIQIKHLQ